ncbi:hypothetical protein ISN44_As12g038380 [Arabidopsis suecica]|uniref:Uncharacterized protein n=1 Tax=Arabidopsis suecica TaxID=45249 RepID=A0A8T1YSA5_ARASU|nr:hypothetical protein ISN44_As12g038380 [Arabidopsis suecica]
METGVVTIQEPVSTKADVGGAPAGVILDKSSMEVHNTNLSSVLDDEITSGDRRNNIVTGEADVVNDSRNKETEELKHEKGEATKTISVVDDSQIVNDDQDSFFIHEPQSFNKTKEDENIILSDVTLEKKKEDDITGKPEEVSVEKPVIEEDQTKTKHSLEQEEDTSNISKDREEIPIKTDEVKEETDSRTVETSVNGTEAEHQATVSVEEISRNGDNIVNETVPEDQTATDGEPLHVVDNTKTVLEVNKEEEEEAEPLYKTVVDDANTTNNEETTAHESIILKGDNHQEEYAEPVEAINNSDDAEQSSREVTVDKEKQEDITQKTEEVQESPRVIETPRKETEEVMDKISKDTEEHEHLLVRDVPVPQGDTLVTEAETADTSTVQEAEILKTNITEKEAVHSAIGGEEEGQETKENTKPSKDLKDDKEQEESETVKTIISSDEVRSSDVQGEVFGEHSEPCSSEIKDGREESIQVKSEETAPEKETAADGESVHGTTQRVLLEAEKEEDKEEIKIDEEPKLNEIEKVETETVKTIVEDPEIVNNVETTVHESESLKENAEPLEAIINSDDTEKISREVILDRGKEEDITPKTEEIQERPSVIETSKIQGEDIESKASLELKEEVDHSSKDTEEHEHLLERDVPQCETIEAEAVETKEDTKPSLDLKEDKEKEETETIKAVISSDEVRSSAVQEEELGAHTEPCSSEIKDESHGREEVVQVKSEVTVQEESTEEKHLLDVPYTESEKNQDNESETTLVSNTESHEKSEESPSDLALSVDKDEMNDEKINVDQVDGTQIMEEHKDLDSNGAEAEQIDQNRTDETEESPVAKPVALPDVESMDQMQKPTLESTSEVSEESSNTVNERIEEKPEEEVTESIELEEQEKETKVEKNEPTNEEVKSDEVIEVLSASPSKELEGETVVEAEKIENIKDNEEEQAAEKIQKSLETVETVESHSSLPSFSEEQEHGAVSEKIEDEKAKEEEPMVQIKSEDDATKSHERQEEFSKDVETKETTDFQAEQTRDIEPSLTEKCSMDQSQPEEQENKLSRKSENNVNETFALHSVEAAEEETAKNGESLHDVETTKGVLLEVEKDEEDADIKTDSEPRLDAIDKEEIETVKTVVEDAKIDKNEEATVHESESLKGDDHQGENAESVEAIKNSDDAEQILSEVTGDREKEEDIAQKAEEVQEIPRVIETPTIQGEDIEPEASLDIKEDVDQSSKDTEQHEHVLERDIPQCETLEAEAVDTSTFQESAILKTLDTNIIETEAVHSEMGGAEEGQETKEDTETSLDLKVGKEQKEAETVKTVIFSDEVRPSDQVDVQAEEFGEHTEPCSSAIKDESQGREESVEVNSKEIVQSVSSEDKDVNLLDIRSEESEKYQENEPDTSLVSKTESGDIFEEIPSVVESAGLDETNHNKTPADVQKPSLETPFELSEETSETINENIEEKPKEEVTLRQEGEEEGSNGLETKEETVLVPESRELGEQAHEEELCLQNEQVEKHEPTKEEVSNDQQSPVEEISDEVIQVSSASPSEGPKDETVAEAETIGEEQVADEIKKSFETVETVEPHSSLLSSSEEKEHETVSEKIDEERVRDAEPTGDMSLKGLEISETTPLSLPSVDQKEDVKALDKEIHVSSVALPLDEQEKVTSTEKGETKANETEDDKLKEHVDSSTSPMFSEKTDNETQTAEAEKEDEEITVSTSKTSENVCMQQEEFRTLETPKPEESKEDKSQEIAETIKEIEATSGQTLPIETSHADNTLSSELVSEQDDQTPKQGEEIHEEGKKEAHEVEATSDRNVPVETSHADNTPSSQLVSELDDQTLKQVDEIHEEETKEEHKLQAEEILPTEIVPRESSDEALVSMLASKEDGHVALQEDNCADGVRETKDIQEERSVSVETEESEGETKPKEPEDEIRDEHVETPTSPIILEENDSETLTAEAKKGNEDINETERTVALESSSTSKKSENVCIKQKEFVNHEAPKLEETKEEKSQEIPETAKAIETTIDQTPSLASDKDDQTPKEVEEILEEETKETHKAQAEPILSTETVPRESFIEAPVSMLASREDEPVTPQEGDYAGNTQEEPHVSVETKPKESEAEGIEKSDDQVEDESTKKTDVEVVELTNDYPTEEAEHGDETYSTLPVVGILTQLQTTLETERAIDDSASSGENSVKEPTDQEQKKSDVEVESNEKDSATGVIEANMLQHDESGETEKVQEESGLAGISLPIEEISLQEEHKEEVKVQDGISREFEVDVEKKLQEETREIADYKEEIPEVLPGEKVAIQSSALPSKELEHVNSAEKQEEREPQQDVNALTSEKQKETHETVKDKIVDNIDEKKNEEVQDEKLQGLSATGDIEEIFSSEVKKDKEDVSEIGVGHDVVTPEVEKEEEPHSVLGNVEEINESVTSEKQITDPVGVIKKASEAEHVSHEETQAISDDTKSNNGRDFPTEQAPKDQSDEVSADEFFTKEAVGEQLQVPSSTVLDDFQENSNTEAVTNLADRDLSVQNPSELIQSHQSPIEETSFEVEKAQEDKNEETVDVLITNVQVKDQPKDDFEAPAKEKEISEQEQKSNDLTDVQEDIGTYVKVQVPDDKLGDVDAIKDGVTVEEKNNTSENIDHEPAKEIDQEESKQTDTVKEEIKEQEKEINQESFNNVKKTEDAIDKRQPEIPGIESLSSVSKTQDKSEQKNEVPNQQTREITNEVPKLENPKIAEELQKKDGESENTKDLFSEVKETEPTLKEPARKSLSDHIQKVKETNKIEDATTEPHVEEEPKTEEDENDDEDHEHKDDKTSPDSIVMVEAKDTISNIKTHKKSHGILSGVGSKVKHSISKVKKVLTGKSSHTTKPSSPK